MPDVTQPDAAVDAEQVSGPVPEQESEQVEAKEPAEKPEPEAKADETDDAEEQPKKRLGGWQRRILKLEQEAEFWRDEALRNRAGSQKDTPPAPTKPTAPKLSTFQGTVEEFEKAQEKYVKDLEAYTEQSLNQRQAQKRIEEASAGFADRLQSLKDYDELDETAQEHLEPNLTKWLAAECALVKNGAEVFHELVMDADLRNELLERARLGDAAGIKGQISALGIALRKKESSAKPEAEKPAPKPKPPSPVTKTVQTDNSLRDDLDEAEWLRRRRAQLKESGQRPW